MVQNNIFYRRKLCFILFERKFASQYIHLRTNKFCQYQHKGRPHTEKKSQSGAKNIEDVIVIFKEVYFPDDHLLHMRNLAEFMPKKPEDVLSREAIPSKY
jgi:hypothetical protein